MAAERLSPSFLFQRSNKLRTTYELRLSMWGVSGHQCKNDCKNRIARLTECCYTCASKGAGLGVREFVLRTATPSAKWPAYWYSGAAAAANYPLHLVSGALD